VCVEVVLTRINLKAGWASRGDFSNPRRNAESCTNAEESALGGRELSGSSFRCTEFKKFKKKK
jgi:hypothetical protein